MWTPFVCVYLAQPFSYLTSGDWEFLAGYMLVAVDPWGGQPLCRSCEQSIGLTLSARRILKTFPNNYFGQTFFVLNFNWYLDAVGKKGNVAFNGSSSERILTTKLW